MKNFTHAPLNFVGAILITLSLSFSGYAQTETLEIGALAPAPSYAMMNLDGTLVSINDIKGENGALVIVTCNSCPFVVGRGENTSHAGLVIQLNYVHPFDRLAQCIAKTNI